MTSFKPAQESEKLINFVVEQDVAEGSSEATAQPDLSTLKQADFPEPPPDLGARYEVLDLVGSGGMGTVWKVYDKELKETFAIKVLKPELLADDVSLKRFQQEARLATDLTHANIAAIFGPGEDTKGRPYIIMRYVEGESLAETLYMEGALEPERALDIFWQVYAALKHSHMKGIIHRDVKPSNIILTRTESGGDLVQLVDFGISKSIHEEVSKTQALTKAVDVFGSPRYMSPEQFLGKEVGPESDLYSLGCVLYEMLVGHPPFTDENPVKLVLQHLQEYPDLTKLRFANSNILHRLLLKDERLRKMATEELELFSDEVTSTNTNLADGFAIGVVTLAFYLPSIVCTMAALFTDYYPLVLLAPPLICNLGFALTFFAMGLNNPIPSKMFKEIRVGILISIISSLILMLLAVLVPTAYLMFSFVLLGSASLITLTVPAVRQRVDSLTTNFELGLTGQQFQEFMAKFCIGFGLLMRLTCVFLLSCGFSAIVDIETCLKNPILMVALLGCLIAALIVNYGTGLLELQSEMKGKTLRYVPIKKLTPQKLRNGLFYITITGLLASGVGLAAGNILKTQLKNHQFPFDQPTFSPASKSKSQ